MREGTQAGLSAGGWGFYEGGFCIHQCPCMQVVNIGTSRLYPWGWRLSLGLAAVPATVLLLGGIFLHDTPNSLIERGHPEEVLGMSLPRMHSPTSNLPAQALAGAVPFANLHMLALTT